MQPTSHGDHHVPFDPGSAAELRRLLGQELREKGVAEAAVAGATHVLFELVMNGVLHGLPDDQDRLRVSWQTEADRLRIAVHDSGTGDDGQQIVALAPTQDALTGRGLLMVDAFSDCWTSERAAGTTVTAWVPLT